MESIANQTELSSIKQFKKPSNTITGIPSVVFVFPVIKQAKTCNLISFEQIFSPYLAR